MFHRSYSKNFCDPLDYESKSILFSESPFTSPCEKFSKEKALSNYIKQKNSFIEPAEITLGIDPTTNKADTIQYVPILKTITRALQHEDVISHCLNSEVPRNDGRIGTYYDSENFKQNKLFNSPEFSIEIILYHDDFNVVNPLGNKVSISFLFYYWQCSKPVLLKAKRYQSTFITCIIYYQI